MGLLSGITDALGLTDTDSGADAAKAAGAASAKAMERARGELEQGALNAIMRSQTGFGGARKVLRPLSTTEGYTSRIMDLMKGGALAPMIEENRQNLLAELSSQGLTRSGAGIKERCSTGKSRRIHPESLHQRQDRPGTGRVRSRYSARQDIRQFKDSHARPRWQPITTAEGNPRGDYGRTRLPNCPHRFP